MRDRLRDAELGDSGLEEGRREELVDNTWMEKGAERMFMAFKNTLIHSS